jgi:hypothetical protein
MFCTKCGTKLPDDAKFCFKCGNPTSSPSGVQVDQKVGTVEGDVTGVTAGEEAASSGLDIGVDQDVDTVEAGGTVTGAVLASPGSRTHIGGTEHHGDVVKGDKRTIKTDGGTYIEGDVSTGGGDFVGRDRITRIGRVDGPVATDGGEAVDMRGAQGAVYKPSGPVSQHFGDVVHGDRADAIAKAFAELHKALEQVPDSPKKAIATQAVEGLQEEAEKGESADEETVTQWFESLLAMLPDIGEVAMNTFLNPVYGLATAFTKIAQKAKEGKEAKQSG